MIGFQIQWLILGIFYLIYFVIEDLVYFIKILLFYEGAPTMDSQADNESKEMLENDIIDVYNDIRNVTIDIYKDLRKKLYLSINN